MVKEEGGKLCSYVFCKGGNNHSNTGVTLSKIDRVDCCANAHSFKNAYFVIIFGLVSLVMIFVI